MRRKFWLLLLLGMLLALTTCQQLFTPLGGGGETDQAVAEAAQKTTEVANLIIEARVTRDFSKLEAYLSTDPAGGEVRKLLEERGVFAEPPKAKDVSLTLPKFWEDVYKNGDVLVCKGSGDPTSDLMSLILVAGYGHGGILNKDFAIEDLPESPCILSADIDYLTKPAEWGNHGLTYETWLEWKNNEIVTLLRSGIPENDLDGSISAVAGLNDGTVYAFLGYPPDFQPFWPIPRMNQKYWYCSKVPWRVYYAYDKWDIENNWFYFGSDHKWTTLQSSILYGLYEIYLKALHPWWPWWYIRLKADERLTLILKGKLNVADGLITPDELRSSATLPKITTWTAGGEVPGDGDWDIVGW